MHVQIKTKNICSSKDIIKRAKEILQSIRKDKQPNWKMEKNLGTGTLKKGIYNTQKTYDNYKSSK